MWIPVSIILRVESSLTLGMLWNILSLPSSLTNSLLEYRILSLQIISISTVTTFCLVSWHRFLLMTNQLPFQLLFLRVLSHYVWQLLRFFSLIMIFISKFGLKFTFTFASWKFRFVLISGWQKPETSLAEMSLPHQPLHFVFMDIRNSSFVFYYLCGRAFQNNF